MCICVFLCVGYVHESEGAHKVQERVSNPLKLKLWAVELSDVGARDRTLVLCKSSGIHH